MQERFWPEYPLAETRYEYCPEEFPGPDAHLVNIIERMRSEPSDPLYVWPEESDVWKFVNGVAQWIHDPMRRGVR